MPLCGASLEVSQTPPDPSLCKEGERHFHRVPHAAARRHDS